MNIMMSKTRLLLMAILACFTLAAAAQQADEGNAPVEWFLDEVVGEVVGIAQGGAVALNSTIRPAPAT